MFPTQKSQLLAGLLLTAACLSAQAIKSPVVNPDRSVTFTLSAPNAKAVLIGGEFDDKLNRPPGALMTRDEKGVWTYTTQPLEPGIYFYGYVVDGLFTVDPFNTRYRPFLRQTPTNNLLEVKADNPFPWEVTAQIPRGSVHVEEFWSGTLNRFANAYVYTPPGYSADAGRSYPVLYLLHGASTGELGDTAREWIAAGYANRILDNLIAAGKAREMIVVSLDSQTPGTSASLSLLGTYELFEKYLVEDVLPLVETRYRADASKSSRWIAGLSRGGAQAFHVAFRRPDMFSGLGAFSIPLPGLSTGFFPDAYPFVKDATSLNSQIPVIFYTVGTDDSDQRPGYESSVKQLNQMGIHIDTSMYPGAHIWQVWRNALTDFLPRLK